MDDANLIAFGAAVLFTAFVGGYVYVRGTMGTTASTPRPQPVRMERRRRARHRAQVSSSSRGSL
jgi:hypothetical protein